MDTSEKSSASHLLYDALDDWTTYLGQNNTTPLKTLYQTKPITMHLDYPTPNQPMRWPAVIRAAYAAIWNGLHSRIIIKAPRGGGKSKLLGTVGFDLWYLKGWSLLNMGGSLVQAEVVYGYFQDYCVMPSVYDGVIGGERGVTMSETTGTAGNEFSCVTASPKSIRGKHRDALFSDETCETSDELLDDALPIVNDSMHPLIVMASTFHKIFGRFAETWDNAVEMGYFRIQWDIFDVCAPFPADFWETGITKDGRPVKNIVGIEKLKAFAKGRTGDSEGWVQIESIVQAWREKPTESWFEVEYMGTRPSSVGLVLKPEDVDRATFDSDKDTRYNFVQGATSVLGIDWGFSSMTAVVEAMAYADAVVVMVDNKNYHQVAADEIIAEVVQKVKEHGIRFIYADSAGKFENVALQNALSKENIGCAVIEVIFSKEKFGTPGPDGNTGMLGNLRAHFEQGKTKLPKRFKDAYYQLKNYRYQEGTDKPIKKDDHIPDAFMCALQHFKLNVVSRVLHVQTEPDKQPSDDSGKRIDPTIEKRGPRPITSGLLKKKF